MKMRIISGSSTSLLLCASAAMLTACHSDKAVNDSHAAVDASSDAQTNKIVCARKALKAVVNDYFDALSAHDPTLLNLAPKVKFTENGEVLKVGKGLWETAGELKFKRSAFDVTTCNSVTESVIAEGDVDIVFGLRIQIEDEQVTEIETIVVRSGDYISSPAGLLMTSDDDWESVLPADERPTREDLAAVVDNYFIEFPQGTCGFADDCSRSENGLPTGMCTDPTFCSDTQADAGSRGMTPRLHVLDVEAGIAVGFTMFVGRTFPGVYTDFHMFEYRDGEVHGVHATLATADQSGWD